MLCCPSLYPRVCSNSCPLSQWWPSSVSSSATPFSSCLQSFPASKAFPINWLFTSGGQSIGASASASVLSMTIQDLFPLELIGLISLLSKGLLRVFSRAQFENINSLLLRLLCGPTVTSIHNYWYFTTSPKILSLRFDSSVVHKCQNFSITISMRPLYAQIEFVSFFFLLLYLASLCYQSSHRTQGGWKEKFSLSESYNSFGI